VAKADFMFRLTRVSYGWQAKRRLPRSRRSREGGPHISRSGSRASARLALRMPQARERVDSPGHQYCLVPSYLVENRWKSSGTETFVCSCQIAETLRLHFGSEQRCVH
jgi:hypothetical protein